MNRPAILLMATVFSWTMIIQAQENNYKVYKEKSDTLQNSYFLKRLGLQFDLRRQKFSESLKTPESILERQTQLNGWYKNIVGKLPEKTNLNIITTKRKGYKYYSIDWIAFESRPDHHITGLFYLPKNYKPPFPAVLIPCGHSFNGKANETYQKAARLFAMNGFAVLQADPICQGERLQYLDKEGKPFTKESVLMHEILGQHLMLTGSNTLIYELYDNIRCIDFLEQLPMIDKNKIAVAGNSGGGTQATYLAAFDKRIKVAVPSCYISTTEKKLNTIGSQDGCQQLWSEGKIGVEEQDFLLMAAPIPILISSATDDYFNIEGAKKAYAELKETYTQLGIPEKVDHIISAGKHGWQKSLREAAVQWCKKWLMNDNIPVIESDDIGFIENEKECMVTKTGQVLTSFKNEKSVADLVRERLKECKVTREKYLASKSRNEIITEIKKLIGYEEKVSLPKYILTDTLDKNNCKIEKYLIQRDSKSIFSLPAVLFIPKNISANSNALIIVSEKGKEDEIKENKRINEELSKGNIILALDVCNTGELKDKKEPQYDNKEYWIAKMPLYEGKTLMTYRMEDILLAKKFLEEKFKTRYVNLFSMGITGPAALHAALIDNSINQVEIYNSIKSWNEIASSGYSSDQLSNIVPDVLNHYDLPDLSKLIQKSKVIFNKM